MLLLCLFNLYAEHIMRKAGLDESPVGIKIAGRNINNLRYADDTTLMAESEEELKSLLMRVKEESAKVGLKLNIKKTKIMASGPLTSWQIDGEEMEVVTDFIFLGFKITTDGDCSQEMKRRLLLGRKVMANLDSILKSRDITLPTKVHIVKAMVFPVAMPDPENETQILWPPNVKEGLPGEEPNAGNNRWQKKKGTAENEFTGYNKTILKQTSTYQMKAATGNLALCNLNFISLLGGTRAEQGCQGQDILLEPKAIYIAVFYPCNRKTKECLRAVPYCNVGCTLFKTMFLGVSHFKQNNLCTPQKGAQGPALSLNSLHKPCDRQFRGFDVTLRMNRIPLRSSTTFLDLPTNPIALPSQTISQWRRSTKGSAVGTWLRAKEMVNDRPPSHWDPTMNVGAGNPRSPKSMG
ncbi:putative uncharacterized transposon-derived protein F52C9.6 [Varanus komodoensis]|nr:putative uncharacterized transposon-derived protein F52C9.6 [Varanus komodoensis]